MGVMAVFICCVLLLGMVIGKLANDDNHHYRY